MGSTSRHHLRGSTAIWSDLVEHIELNVLVKAPAELVWNQITNWSAQSEWMLGTKVRGTGNSVGGTIEAFTGIGPIGFLDTMEITLWEPPKRCDVLHTGRVVKGTGSFQVESLAANLSRFIWIEDLDLPLGIVGKIGFKILRPFFVYGVQTSLNKFAKSVSEMAK